MEGGALEPPQLPLREEERGVKGPGQQGQPGAERGGLLAQPAAGGWVCGVLSVCVYVWLCVWVGAGRGGAGGLVGYGLAARPTAEWLRAEVARGGGRQACSIAPPQRACPCRSADLQCHISAPRLRPDTCRRSHQHSHLPSRQAPLPVTQYTVHGSPHPVRNPTATTQPLPFNCWNVRHPDHPSIPPTSPRAGAA